MPPVATPVPVITALSPKETTAGGPGFTLTINGDRFASDAFVNWSGTHPATTVVTQKQLTAKIPATAIAIPGTAGVSVTNPNNPPGVYGSGTTGVTSNVVNFTIKQVSPRPGRECNQNPE